MVHIRERLRIAFLYFPLTISSSTGRLAESDPHTMHEDKVILESLLTRNRSAIHDFHNTSGVPTVNRSLSRTKTPTTPGQHLRALTDATGVDVPPMPDVLPPEKKDSEADEARNMSPASLDRTFSKRGARLGVHMSILDMNAHEASDDNGHSCAARREGGEGYSGVADSKS